MNPDVDFYFAKAKAWIEELACLRDIALQCHLEEVLKWGCPCYTFGKHNVVLIHAFKGYCAFLFFKGALLRDPAGILIQQTANVQAARQARFTSAEQIKAVKSTLREYILEAVQVEEKGLKVELKTTVAFEMPTEFKRRLDALPKLAAAFAALTPGRQRAYLLHFAAAKQAKTRESRIEKCMPAIMNGKGLSDE